MTLSYLLDTSIVSNPVTQTPSDALLERLDATGFTCAIAAPVWHELLFGCRRLARGRRRAALESYLQDVVREAFPILPYDDVAAAWHATERARLERLGRPAPFVDGQIASIAKVNSLTLITANIKDFQGFKGLAVENWLQPARRGSR